MSLLPAARRIGRRTLLVLAGVAAPAAVLGAAPAQAAPAVPGRRPDVEKRNSAIVRAAYADFFGRGRTELFSRYFAEDLVQHDPAIAAGRAGLVAAVRAQIATTPRPVITIKHLLADGAFVAVHTHVSPTPGDEFTGRATIELYRLADDRIVEHWALTQDVPATSASGFSMFSDRYRYPGPAPAVTPAQEDTHKQLIRKAWAAIFSVRDLTVLDRYWAGPDYLQHNPRVPDGTAALGGYLGTLPPSVSQNRFALADGDLVLTLNQSLATSADLTSDAVGTAVADLYRVVGMRVVEHWDVVQPVPATTANGNSMFSRLYPER